MPRNPRRTRCQVPGCRNWAMRGHSHWRPLRDRIQASAGASAPGRPATCSRPPCARQRLMAHIPPFESGKKGNGKTITGTTRMEGDS
jgi:hypothetical protein